MIGYFYDLNIKSDLDKLYLANLYSIKEEEFKIQTLTTLYTY